ncbi:MAG: hypothetical protein Q8K82_15580, partial [Gemmatimonadaceae bacterium]|nr:hypothetical protein [Gemmatimonadaceae bacterium]
MRYRLTAELQGQTVSAQSYEWEAPEHTVGLVLSEKGRVSHIWIEARVVDFEPYLPRLTPHTDGPSVIGIPAVRVREHLLDILQYLESLGSFWFGIERLNWGSAKEEWLPDSAEEKARLSISAFSHKLEYPATPVPVKPDVIAGLLGKREVLSYLTIPMSFYREGTNAYRDHKYVAAFRNFY